MWNDAITCTLVDLPLLPLARQLDVQPVETLRKTALSTLRLDHLWHQEDITPRSQTKPSVDPRAHSVKLLPGGRWLVVVTRDLHLRLVNLAGEQDDVVMPLHTGNARLVLRAVTQVFYSSSHETLLLVCTTSSIRSDAKALIQTS